MGVSPHHARSRARRRWQANSWAFPVTALAALAALLAIALAVTGVPLRAVPSASSSARKEAASRAGTHVMAAGDGHAAGDSAAAAGAGAAAGNANCTLIVPASPLTATGLATPYQLTATNPADGPCHETDPDQAAFVQGAIINPATGAISVYDPLVVDAGTAPAIAPTPPALPHEAIVALWFGFNGDVLTLQGTSSGTTLAASRCVNGLGSGPSMSPFGQLAYCNARSFFRAANRAVRRHLLTVPAPGTGKDGLPCLTTRNFGLVDQDQSDNVTAQYLITAQGKLAQDTAAGRRRFAGATVLDNGSDNGLLAFSVAPALGCTPWLAPDLADGRAPVPALPLNELQARYAAARPAALVPENDPMTTVGGALDRAKTDAYRAGVDQQRLPAGQSPARYCRLLERIQGRRLQQDVNLLTGQPSPVAGTASDLFTFLASRLQQSFVNLGCGKFGLVNDVTITADSNGAAVAACFRQQASPLTPGPGNPTAGQRVCPPSAATPAPSATQSPAVTQSATPTQSAAPTRSATPTQSPAPTQSPTAVPTQSPTAPPGSPGPASPSPAVSPSSPPSP